MQHFITGDHRSSGFLRVVHRAAIEPNGAIRKLNDKKPVEARLHPMNGANLVAMVKSP